MASKGPSAGAQARVQAIVQRELGRAYGTGSPGGSQGGQNRVQALDPHSARLARQGRAEATKKRRETAAAKSDDGGGILDDIKDAGGEFLGKALEAIDVPRSYAVSGIKQLALGARAGTDALGITDPISNTNEPSAKIQASRFANQKVIDKLSGPTADATMDQVDAYKSAHPDEWLKDYNGFIKQHGEEIAKKQAYVKEASAGPSLDNFMQDAKDHIGYAQALNDVSAGEAGPAVSSTGIPGAYGALGFAGDVFADPLTHGVVEGAGNAAKYTNKAAGIAEEEGAQALKYTNKAEQTFDLAKRDKFLAKAASHDEASQAAKEILAKVGRAKTPAALTAEDMGTLGEKGGYKILGMDVGGQDVRNAIYKANPLSRSRVAIGDVLSRAAEGDRPIVKKLLGETRGKYAPIERDIRSGNADIAFKAQRTKNAVQAMSSVSAGARHEFLDSFGQALKGAKIKPEELSDVMHAVQTGDRALIAKVGKEKFDAVSGWYSDLRNEYMKATGNDLPQLDHYVNRQLTDEMKALKKVNRRASLGTAVEGMTKRREITNGSKLFGDVVPEGLDERGIINWANDKAEELFGHSMYKTDPNSLVHDYAHAVARSIGQAKGFQILEDAGLMRTADVIGMTLPDANKLDKALAERAAAREGVEGGKEAARKVQDEASYATQAEAHAATTVESVGSLEDVPELRAEFNDKINAGHEHEDVLTRQAVIDDPSITEAVESLKDAKARLADMDSSVEPLDTSGFPERQGAIGDEGGVKGGGNPTNGSVRGSRYFDSSMDWNTLKRIARQDGIDIGEFRTKDELLKELNANSGISPDFRKPGAGVDVAPEATPKLTDAGIERERTALKAEVAGREQAIRDMIGQKRTLVQAQLKSIDPWAADVADAMDYHQGFLDSMDPTVSHDPKSVNKLDKDLDQSIKRNARKIERGGKGFSPDRYLASQEHYGNAKDFLEQARQADDPFAQQSFVIKAQAEQQAGLLEELHVPLDKADAKITKLSDDFGFQKQWADNMQQAAMQFFKGQEYRMDPEVYGLMQKVADLTSTTGRSELMSTYDSALNWLKAYQIASPGFHVRNALSGIFNNALAGIRPGVYLDWLKANSAYTKGEEAWSAYRGTNPQMADWFEEIRRGTGRGQIGEELEQAGVGGRKGNWFLPGKNHPAIKFSEKVGTDVEAFLRGSLALDTLQTGGKMDEALERIAQYHFDYEDLTGFERKVVKRVIPFYTWSRHNIPLQMEMLLKRPSVYSKYNSYQRNVSYGAPQESVIPQYFKDSDAFPTNFKVDGNVVYGTPNALPLADLGGGGGGNLLDPSNYASMVTPLIKTPLELLAGKQAFHGIPLTDKKQAAPIYLKPFAPVFKAVGLMDDKGQIGQRNQYVIEQFMPWLARANRLDMSTEKNAGGKGTIALLNLLFNQGLLINTPQSKKSEKFRRLLESGQLEQQSVWVPKGRRPITIPKKK